MNQQKRCPKCQTIFTGEAIPQNFYKASSSKDGYQSLCKLCKSSADKLSRKKHDTDKKYKESLQFVFSSMKRRLKEEKIPFLVSEVDFFKKFEGKHQCSLCSLTSEKNCKPRVVSADSLEKKISDIEILCPRCFSFMASFGFEKKEAKRTLAKMLDKLKAT